MLFLRSPAKLNLTLAVGAPRPDGYHPLASWFTTLGLYDDLTFQRHPAPGIHLTCDDPNLATDDTNLIVRAAKALLRSLPDDEPARKVGIAISLTKRIPMGAGLGGGSSNAACTLLGIDELLSLRLPHQHLADLGAGLGSDIPFFLGPSSSPSALATGRGEVLHGLAKPVPKAALLFLPAIHLATPAVYQEFDRLGLGSSLQNVDPPNLSSEALMPLLRNDLEAAAFSLRPELGGLRQQLEERLARPVRMSGSGSALFTLFDTKAEASSSAGKVAGLSVTSLAVDLCPSSVSALGLFPRR